MFVSEDMIQALTEHTNQYSFQKTGTTINTNTKETEQMIGMYLTMGLVIFYKRKAHYNYAYKCLARSKPALSF